MKTTLEHVTYLHIIRVPYAKIIYISKTQIFNLNIKQGTKQSKITIRKTCYVHWLRKYAFQCWQGMKRQRARIGAKELYRGERTDVVLGNTSTYLSGSKDELYTSSSGFIQMLSLRERWGLFCVELGLRPQFLMSYPFRGGPGIHRHSRYSFQKEPPDKASSRDF